MNFASPSANETTTAAKPPRMKILAAALSALALTACATATPYQPLQGNDGGYASTRIDENRYRVRFVGNAVTDREQVENFLLFRAAQLTVEEGYTCFTPVARDTERQVDYRVRRDFAPGGGFYRGWTPYWDFYGPFGTHFYDPWIGSPFFPDRYDINTVDSYTATAEIVLKRGNCTGDQTFDASRVIQNLRPIVERPDEA